MDMDAVSITRLSATCWKWKNLVISFSNLIHKNIAKRDLRLSGLPRNFRSYHQLVLAHEALKRRICFPLDDDQAVKSPMHYILAWPVHESSAYMVALSGSFLIWVDIENMRKMYVKDLRSHDWGKDDLIIGDYVLRGHAARIGLILANNDGLLVSFDISCDIYVWDVNLKKLERKINTREELGMIMSMNLHKNLVVCAGINGKIAVWDACTGGLIHSFFIPSTYIDVLEEHQLNVSIYGDLVAFGLSDGKFYIFSISEKRLTMEFDVNKQKSSRMQRINQNIENTNMASDNNTDADIFTGNDLENEVTLEQFEDDTGTESDGSDIFDVFEGHHSSAPLTLSLSSHFLLTNGPDPSCLALWNVLDGAFLGLLDDTHISKINRSKLGPLRFAEISVDGSMIYSVSGDLMVWNFMDLTHRESKGVHRYFVKGKLNLGDDLWIGYENHEKPNV